MPDITHAIFLSLYSVCGKNRIGLPDYIGGNILMTASGSFSAEFSFHILDVSGFVTLYV